MQNVEKRLPNFMEFEWIVFEEIKFKHRENCHFDTSKIYLVGHIVAAILDFQLWYRLNFFLLMSRIMLIFTGFRKSGLLNKYFLHKNSLKIAESSLF
jgi:hypothetical protein